MGDRGVRSVLIDTAGPVVGLASFDRGELRYAASARVASGAEVWLARELELALAALSGLDRVGVVVGPGTFTGVRVGVAAALGLAFARNVGVAPLSSLALRATLAPGRSRVLSLLDAKKGRVYAGWYDTRGPVPVALDEERDIPLSLAALGAPGIGVGEGAAVFRESVLAAGHEVAVDADRTPVLMGECLVVCAAALSPERVGLRYLREPDARPSIV